MAVNEFVSFFKDLLVSMLRILILFKTEDDRYSLEKLWSKEGRLLLQPAFWSNVYLKNYFYDDKRKNP